MIIDLRSKSVHELRVMAQAFGVTEIFEKDQAHLAQEIELKQQKMIAPVVPLPPKPAYDARLMTKPPSRRSSMDEVVTLLEPLVKLGLHLHFDEERWYMSFGKKTDEGTIRMPLRNIYQCAEKVMK